MEILHFCQEFFFFVTVSQNPFVASLHHINFLKVTDKQM